MNTDKLKKRAAELKASGKTQQEIAKTLDIEKNLWYFWSQQSTTPPAAQNVTPAPAGTSTPQTTPQTWGVDFIKKLKTRNDADAVKFAQINQQNAAASTPPPVTPTTPPPTVTPAPTYKDTKPSYAPMEAWAQGAAAIQNQWIKQQQDILQQYNDDIAMIKLEEDQQKAQYKNADQVLAWIRGVEDAYKRGITDPQQIAAQTGIPIAQVQQVLRGEAFKALELQDWVTEDARKEMEMKMTQLQTSTRRGEDDFTNQAERSKYAYDNQVEDMIQQAGLSEAAATKMGALTGNIQSSGYRMAITMAKDDLKKWLDRLAKIQGWEQDDIATARTRLLEDFETNTTAIKQYFDTGMNTLRMQGMAQIQQIHQKYGVASQNTVNSLKQLYNDMETQKVSLLNETMWLQQSFNEMWKQEIDVLEQRSTTGSWDRNKDIQTYLDLYKTNPALANSMFPELANQVNNTNFQNFDMSLDFSWMPDIIKQFPNEARAKNNNPGGIKTASPALQQAWRDAGISFQTWTKPPPWENQANPYTKFATIGDWLKAQWIALSRGGGDINARLQKRVGTAEWPNYAQQVMWWAGIPQGTTFQELTQDQQQALQMAVIRKESWGLYNLMTKWWAGGTPSTPWMPWSTPLSPEAQSVIDGMITIDKIPSDDRIRILQEIQTNGKQLLSTKVVNNAKKSIDLVAEILESPWFSWAVGLSPAKLWGLKETPIASTPAYDTYLQIQSLKALISIPYLENMKGLWAMSEVEFNTMKSAASAMDANMSEKAFKKEMEKIKEAMNSMITRNGGQTYWWTTTNKERSPKDTWFVLPPKK